MTTKTIRGSPMFTDAARSRTIIENYQPRYVAWFVKYNEVCADGRRAKADIQRAKGDAIAARLAVADASWIIQMSRSASKS